MQISFALNRRRGGRCLYHMMFLNHTEAKEKEKLPSAENSKIFDPKITVYTFYRIINVVFIYWLYSSNYLKIFRTCIFYMILNLLVLLSSSVHKKCPIKCKEVYSQRFYFCFYLIIFFWVVINVSKDYFFI